MDPCDICECCQEQDSDKPSLLARRPFWFWVVVSLCGWSAFVVAVR